MTTLNKVNIGKTLEISGALENRIIHDVNNGGAKSTYGLNMAQRNWLIQVIFSNSFPKCNCLECL
jgi:hypothetical protein